MVWRLYRPPACELVVPLPGCCMFEIAVVAGLDAVAPCWLFALLSSFRVALAALAALVLGLGTLKPRLPMDKPPVSACASWSCFLTTKPSVSETISRLVAASITISVSLFAVMCSANCVARLVTMAMDAAISVFSTT